AEPVADGRPWATTRPHEYREAMQDADVTALMESATSELLETVGVATDRPNSEFAAAGVDQSEKEAVAALRRAREMPWLEAHPKPLRDQTFAHVSWSLERTQLEPPSQGVLPTSYGAQVFRSGHSLFGGGEVRNGTRSLAAGPLAALAFKGHDRNNDAEMQGLALVLEE
ncbi:unnamed protein product, partial [Polarella glacialis]